jgi:hypothetical protein
MWNGNRGSRVEGRESRVRGGRVRSLRFARRSSRRGVLLIVVLSMLVLFMLVGTAFLMSSNQSRTAAKGSAKIDRLGNYATKLLERAALQVIRDTDNPNSVIRYHSLLRDLYGTDGFQAVVYVPSDLSKEGQYVARFAGAVDGTNAQLLGQTNGQFIDLYMSQKPYAGTDYTIDYNAVTYPLDLRNVIKLDRNVFGKPQPFFMPVTRGYFNGCLLTITSGAAAGRSARILDYEYVGDTVPATTPAVRVFRFRVMAFQRNDGQPLQIDNTTGLKRRTPEIIELAGASFMVNGRAFSGTGVGYNPLATTGQPRLNALQLFPITTTNYIGAEIALLPNSVYFDPLGKVVLTGAAPPGVTDPFGTALPVDNWNTYTATKYWPLNFNPPSSTSQINGGFRYPTWTGPGGGNESYDAPDFQNMAMASQTVSPRAQGRVVHSGSSGPFSIELDQDSNANSTPDVYENTDKFLRMDLEDVPIPSFHRPDLVNFWYHRLLKYLTSNLHPSGAMTPEEAVQVIVQPYSDDPNDPIWTPNRNVSNKYTIADAALISAIKRQAMLRPTREDHLHFDGSNPRSLPYKLKGISPLVVNGNIAVPIWDIVGPADVDNDNDGVADSNWVDLGDPILETEDGRRYKTIYAIHVVDLDGRLNVNAHGRLDDVVPPFDTITQNNQTTIRNLDPTRTTFFDPTFNTTAASWFGNLAGLYSSLRLPRGIGYGPADISLRPVFPAPLDSSRNPFYGNRSEAANGGLVDSYATLQNGRFNLNGTTVNGRNGYDTNLNASVHGQAATAGTNYLYQPLKRNKEPSNSPRWYTGEEATPSVAAQMKFFEYPWSFIDSVYFQRTVSGYGTLPDFKARYALGVGYAGQPVYEVATQWDANNNFVGDWNPNAIPTQLVKTTLPNGQKQDLPNGLPANLLANTPYELDLSNRQRRDSLGGAVLDPSNFPNAATTFNKTIDRSLISGMPDYQCGLVDDAAYSPTDLEKILRSGDADSGTLPSRLWDVVNDFDPIKLLNYDPNRVQMVADLGFGNHSALSELSAAQEIAAINRRLVTTDSVSLPVANVTPPAYLLTDSNFLIQTKLRLRPPRNIAEMFEVRIRRALGLPTLYDEYDPNGDHDNDGTPNATDPDYSTAAAVAARNTRASRISAIINGGTWTDYTVNPNVVHAEAGIAAPELIAGMRMDLNRPFGDGQDNPNPITGLRDGVVDDPMEAGDPFLDVNGNGKWDSNLNGKGPEPFIDVDGSGGYTPPSDQLWANLTTNGQLAESIVFDYTNGQGTPLHPAMDQVVSTFYNVPLGTARIRNLESQGRQLMARHLYCLMLLMVDENYIAPWDEKDPQINRYLDTSILKSTAKNIRDSLGPNPDPDPIKEKQQVAKARAILLRKLTCRQIAQWAINCVDMRDADAIMTPFEYDENPWDGWGTRDRAGNVIPLDGDPATDENGTGKLPDNLRLPEVAAAGQPKLATDNMAEVIFWNASGLKTILTASSTQVSPVTGPATSIYQTRSVVWGAERPELLITETLAWHDRRTENLNGSEGSDKGRHDDFAHTNPNLYKDDDMDQRLRPKGSLFVELYNPWPADGQLPAELYSRCDASTLDQTKKRYVPALTNGVDLSRVSTWGVRELYDATDKIINPNDSKLTADRSGVDSSNKIVKRSPVWRLIVVDDWPRGRNRDRSKIGNSTKSQTSQNTKAMDVVQFPKFEQRMGNTPPDVNPVLPPGVSIPAGSDLPAYLTPMVTDVEGWDEVKAPPYRTPDPDFDPVFNAGFTPTQVANQTHDTSNVNLFNIEYPYIEREFYFTTDDSPTKKLPTTADHSWGQFMYSGPVQTQDWDYSPNQFRLRIPDRYIKLSGVKNGPDANLNTKWARTQKFIPITLEKQKFSTSNDPPITPTDPQAPVLAPILPGRYGVVGTAGTRYFKDTSNPMNPNVYTSMVGRPESTADGKDPTTSLDSTRRIEFRPNSNPDFQQVSIGSNGGDPKDQIQKGQTYDPFSTEIGRDNELIRNDTPRPPTVENLTSPDTAANNLGKAKYYQPCVAIPVEGMSASEPPWGYGPRETQAIGQEHDIVLQKAQEEQPPRTDWDPPTDPYQFDPTLANGEGAYPVAYDKPFDIASELIRTGTTANYRTIHLQRLANPQLPWNPPPNQFTDQFGNDVFRPNLPVNPYRTIDSSSLNLTAFNGTSSDESDIGGKNSGLADDEGKLRPWTGDVENYRTGLFGQGQQLSSAKQVWWFRSTERGFWSRINYTAGLGTNPALASPQRVLWAQEPALVELRKLPLPAQSQTMNVAPELFDVIAGRQMTMRVDEVPFGSSDPPANQAFGNKMDDLASQEKIVKNHCDMVLEHSLGFGNKSFGLLYDRKGARQKDFPAAGPYGSAYPIASAIGSPAPYRCIFPYDVNPTDGSLFNNPPPVTVSSTYPWVAWDNRPYVSAEELLKVPAASQSQMLRSYSAIDLNIQPAKRANPYGLAPMGTAQAPIANANRWLVMHGPFAQLPDMFAASSDVAGLATNSSGALLLDANNNPEPYGAANFYRILEFVRVPSPFIGTDTMLNAETFNDPVGNDIVSTNDPRYNFQPPYNNVARQRDPGKVNLNTVTGSRMIDFNGVPRSWSEVFDGIMGRSRLVQKNPKDNTAYPIAGDGNIVDSNNNLIRFGQPGPAWRDVVLSRRGYAQVDAGGNSVDKPPAAISPNQYPDTFAMGLNSNFPTVFANPFRSPNAGDLVPVAQMMQFGVDASLERAHPRYRGSIQVTDPKGNPVNMYDPQWGGSPWPPTASYTPFNDARDAGLGNDMVSVRADGAIPSNVIPLPSDPAPTPADPTVSTRPQRDTMPLFGEKRDQAFADTDRNSYMMYEPMSRLGSLVTDRSGVYAVWITVGYFEVEKAPDWNDPDTTVQANVRAHFGNDINLYNRAYPDGYMLSKEIGVETGDMKRPRGFYIIDRTEEVGFKPGEDFNVEKTIRLRRRIE